jgi:hypothetical protein
MKEKKKNLKKLTLLKETIVQLDAIKLSKVIGGDGAGGGGGVDTTHGGHGTAGPTG